MAILQSTTVTGSLIISGSQENLVQIIGSGSTLFAVNGASGQLFGVSDDLTDSLFSVNTIAGLPVIEAFADNTVKIGTYGSEELIVSSSQVYITSASLSGPTLFLDGNVGILNTAPGEALTVGDGTADTSVAIKKSDNNVSDHLQFFNGTTRVGEIGTQDDTWLRINQVTSKNIYTPRYIRADGGFFVDSTSYGINGSGRLLSNSLSGTYSNNLTFSGNITVGGNLIVNNNVGIGESTPDFALQVATPEETTDPISFAFDITRENSGIRGMTFGMATNDTFGAIGTHNADLQLGHTFGTESNGQPAFYPTLTIQHIDQSVGNVGIGTTSPSEKLHVQGNITSSGNLTLEGNAGYPIFESGFGGSGWRVDSSANAEFQNLTVRGTFSVYELLAQQIRATNGSLLVATSGKVESTGSSTLFFDTGSQYGHGFLPGDILLAQRLDPGGGQLKRTFLTVNTVSSTGSLTYKDLSGNPPEAGQEFVRIGSTSSLDRQGHIYLTADDSNAPYIGVRDGVSGSTQFTSGTGSIEKVRVGRLDGLVSSTFGSLSGYGFWAKGNAYLEGGISATFGDIGGFNITDSAITSSGDLLSLKSNGQITASNALIGGTSKIAGFTVSDTQINSGTNLVLKSSGQITGSNVLFTGGKISGSSLAIDVTTLTAKGNTVEISGSNFHLLNGNITASNVNLSGNISATTGNIGGFAITSDAITGSGFYLSGSATGNEFFISSSNFNVKANGDVTGSSVLFDGGKIGGFDITSDKLSITSGDFEILQGSLFSNNIGYRVVETTGGSRQINMRYDTADDSLEFLIYKDTNNYFNVGDAYADQYTGWGLNLRVDGEDILKVENDIVTLSGFTATKDAFAGDNFYISGSATGNEFFISSSNFNVKANGDVTGSSVLFTGGRIGDEYQNITFDPTGNITLNNVELKVSDTTGLRSDIYDGANSKRVVLRDDTIAYTTFEDDTLITIIGTDGAIKSTITVDTKYTEGTISATDIAVGDIIDSDKPVSLVNTGGGHAVLPFSFLSKTFLLYVNRYHTRTIRVFSPFGDATVSASFDSTNDGTFNDGVAATIAPQNTATDINASDIISGTWPTSGDDYFKIESDFPILAFNDGPTGDYVSLYPLSKEILHADEGVGINLNGNTSITHQGGGYYTGNTPFQVQRIGDGGGGDSDQGMPLQGLGDTYIIPHSVGGYEIVSVEPNIVKAYTLTAGTKTLSNTVDHSAASKTNPLNTTVGSDNSGGSGIHTGAMLFEGTAPFALRTQDPGDDEYHVIGYRRTQRQAYDNSTTIKGDRIRTGKIQSNNWNDSTAGSLIDLNLGTAHLGGSGSNASFYFDGTDLFLTGSVNATDGNFTGTISAGDGDIGGFTISSDALSGTNFYLSGSATGNEFFISSSNFNVKANGDVTGSSVLLDGGEIGGFTISETFISSSGLTLLGTGTITAGSGTNRAALSAAHPYYRFWAGATDAGSPGSAGAPFRVRNTGVLEATGAIITGSISATSGNFTGTISAGDGDIGGFTISSDALSGTNFYLSGSATGNEFFISASNFNVKANGDVTASNANIEGRIVAETGELRDLDVTGTLTMTNTSDGTITNTDASYIISSSGIFLNAPEGSGASDSSKLLFKGTTGSYPFGSGFTTVGELFYDGSGGGLTLQTISGNKNIFIDSDGTLTLQADSTVELNGSRIDVNETLQVEDSLQLYGTAGSGATADVTFINPVEGTPEEEGGGVTGGQTGGDLTISGGKGGDVDVNNSNDAANGGNLILKAGSGGLITGGGSGNPGTSGSILMYGDVIINSSGSTVFDVQGSQGQLFSVTDDLTGTLFSVNDISGIPILSVDSDDTVTMGTFGTNALVVSGSKVGIGTDTPSEKLQVEGNISASGNIIIADGQGIDFSATGELAGMTSELLDDYEEGTFTPTYGHTGGNPSTVTYDTGNTYGKYTKIGDIVHCSGRIRTDAITWSSTTLNTVLKGFPFTCSSPLSTGTGCVAGVIGFAGGFSATKPVAMQMRSGQTEALLYGESITSNEVQGQPNIQSGDFTTGTNADKNFITFQITYHTT